MVANWELFTHLIDSINNLFLSLEILLFTIPLSSGNGLKGHVAQQSWDFLQYLSSTFGHHEKPVTHSIYDLSENKQKKIFILVHYKFAYCLHE